MNEQIQYVKRLTNCPLLIADAEDRLKKSGSSLNRTLRIVEAALKQRAATALRLQAQKERVERNRQRRARKK